MSAADQQLRRDILAYIYEEQSDDFRRTMVRIPTMVEECDDFDRDELRYHLNRLSDDQLVEQRSGNTVQITPDGIEKLDQEGYDTLLDSDLRYEILRIFYEHDRGTPNAIIHLDEVLDDLAASEEELGPHLWYLSEKRLIEQIGIGASPYQLTSGGRNAYEAYREEGIPIPQTDPLQRFTQHTIEQGDVEKAENVFRDIVEVAREEIIVIDAYAKARLYEMLEEHVPSVVDAKILASDHEIEEDNIDRFHEFVENRDGDAELRYLDYWGDYPFHTREVIRDREAGWIWDHTFADAGGRHHTISQLRPVNLETDLEVFDEAWRSAESVE